MRFLWQPGPEGPETATPYNKDTHNAIGVFFSTSVLGIESPASWRGSLL